MGVEMDAKRFEDLAAAYGADLRRWPESDRASAAAFMDAQATGAQRILFEARLIDAALDASPAQRPGDALRQRVMEQAVSVGLRPRPQRRWSLGPLAWASGAGWAAACAAGLVIGLDLGSELAADAQADAVLYQASLAAADDTEILG